MIKLTEGKPIRIFEFNDVKGEFEELDIDPELPLYKLLDSDSILLFIDPKNNKAWIWIGNNTTTRMKFHAVFSSYSIRDSYAFGYKIVSVNEGDESREFKVMIGLEKKEELVEEKVEPVYKETEEFKELIESFSLERLLLILEKIEIPDGYERRLVIANNEIYLYKEYDKSLGSDVKQKRLFTLKEEVDDGSYLMEDYTPRLIFSFNKLLLIEFLQKIVF